MITVFIYILKYSPFVCKNEKLTNFFIHSYFLGRLKSGAGGKCPLCPIDDPLLRMCNLHIKETETSKTKQGNQNSYGREKATIRGVCR